MTKNGFAQDLTSTFDFESILHDLKTDILTAWNQRGWNIKGLSESDPAMRLLQIAAYRELYLRQEIQESINNCHLKNACGVYLDRLAALLDERRLPQESDNSFRERISMIWENAKPIGTHRAYEEKILSHSAVKDVRLFVEEIPDFDHGQALDFYILLVPELAEDPNYNREKFLTEIRSLVENVRLVTDYTRFYLAEIKPYTIDATLKKDHRGPGRKEILLQAKKDLEAYVIEMYRLGRTVNMAAVQQILRQSGAQAINLSINENVETSGKEAPLCRNISIVWED